MIPIVFGGSVTGASHIRSQTPCQDNSKKLILEDGTAILAVADGHGSKPFELPQQDPDYHRQFLKSYNIPELMRGPVEVSPQEFADILKSGDGVPVKYVQKLGKKE